jgi:hypothetical protein
VRGYVRHRSAKLLFEMKPSDATPEYAAIALTRRSWGLVRDPACVASASPSYGPAVGSARALLIISAPDRIGGYRFFPSTRQLVRESRRSEAPPLGRMGHLIPRTSTTWRASRKDRHLGPLAENELDAWQRTTPHWPPTPCTWPIHRIREDRRGPTRRRQDGTRSDWHRPKTGCLSPFDLDSAVQVYAR